MTDPVPSERPRRRAALPVPRSMRVAMTRGIAWNAAFQAFATVVQLLRGVLVAALVAPEEYGLWGGVLAIIGAAGVLKQVGILEAYLADQDEDEERSFRAGFTLELGVNAILTGLIVLAAPVMAVVYGDVEMLWLVLASTLAAPAMVLQAGMWPLIRSLQFGRLRLMQTIEPLLGTAITVALAVAGLGAWSLVIGGLVGAWATAALAVRACPFPLRPIRDVERLRSRLKVSAPVAAATGSAAVVLLGSVIAAELLVGTAAVGAITLASTVALAAQRLDAAIADAVMPAISARREDRGLLVEAFGKANQMSLLWAGPVGAACALFPTTLVHVILGERWEPMIPVLRWFGIAIVIGHVGTNLWQFLLVRGHARSLLALAAVHLGGFVALTVPLLAWQGVDGYGIALALTALIGLLTRAVLARRLFPGLSMARHAGRALAPTVLASAAALACYPLPVGVRIGVFGAIVLASVGLFERRLAKEAARYLLGRGLTA
ncbi:Membrane protein involved in the export of O-antigen and teichoic acid [Patulibacter medicamentivorans]|uniref:Membrane protein involved in the export of O-antigen and teichoic acid n=1 Tax=Patulibacter medicamentivorans TaxID=1097667 RepID=H0EAV7_9ACTN|nr:oligosaccharide flippase family protein [Patulibacter medicamentivorans]EHN09175.1 Membrane protein involved in the export of O-antigen and teichoic acid [Patulibacter medicamentivorans]